MNIRYFIFLRQVVLSVLTLSALSLSSCKKSSDSTTDDGSSSGSSTDILQAATSNVGEAFQSSSSQPLFHDFKKLNDYFPLAACSTLSFSSCSSGVRTRDFTASGCTRTGPGGNTVTVYGIVTHSFDSQGNCTSTVAGMSSGTMTRTLSNHYVEASDGAKIHSYTSAGTVGDVSYGSDDLKTWDDLTKSGGTTITKTSASTGTISIDGIHRRGIRASGIKGFWHTVYTTAPISFSVSSGTYTINSGTNVVAHNRLGVNYTVTFNSDSSSPVVYDGSCCYPISGKISQQIGSGTAVVTEFTSTCGSVTVDGTAATLPACGGGTP